MTKRMMLAALLALAAVPVLAADTAADRKAVASTSDEARALAGRQIVAQEKANLVSAQACSCKHGS